MSFRPSSLLRSVSLLAAISTVALMTGCANMVTTADGTNAFSTPGTMSGKIHGGVQPVSGSSVKLYSVGTTGYGSAGTLLATTSTSASGIFNFTQVTSGATGPAGNSYICPSSTALLYIIASGGNTQGTGSSNNTAAVFIAPVGACGTSASATVNMTELVTAATVSALQQYIGHGTTAGTESIGSPNTTQAKLGLTNAFATVSNLVNLTTGTVVASFTPTTGTNAAGVTVTGTPESGKLDAIANILASCVNNTSNTAPNCVTLFTNAVPPASATVTSQPAATFAAAVDTVQAAYYMAINPADITTGGDQTNTKLTALFALSTPSSPYQTAITSLPSDWTLGITYTFSGTCTNASAASFMSSAESVAVDASGNVWFNNGSTSGVNALQRPHTHRRRQRLRLRHYPLRSWPHHRHRWQRLDHQQHHRQHHGRIRVPGRRHYPQLAHRKRR